MALNANVLNNTLEFLRRVEMKGLEAFVFVEAYTAVQNEHALVTNPQLAKAIAAQQALANPETQPPTPADSSTAAPEPTTIIYAEPEEATEPETRPVESISLAESTQKVVDAGQPAYEHLPAQDAHAFRNGPIGASA